MTVPADIEPYLKEIAERLVANHASVMVGAGFSMNAQRSEQSQKHSPAWHDLGDCFYRKLHCKSPEDSDKCYLDVLKLAEEVEATYGRTTLDNLLKSEIPDRELQPSALHKDLLRLPWVDVFTTNYDTLLERAATSVWERRYETIDNKDDLVWSQTPRIIKLHGSFPSSRPFIITEEDYRRYPKDFAPFVNTLQQSLLENTLCLIGFSGNDPNFTKWIGWIRDNLGKDNSPKIYMILVKSLTNGQMKLLEERNIVPIDLSRWHEKPSESLKWFIDFLLDAKRDRERGSEWGKHLQRHSFDPKKELIPQYESIVSSWESERLSYPNWLILPRSKRWFLRETTQSSYSFLHEIDKVPAPLNLRFLYELNWRIEKYLSPIFNDWAPIYERIIDNYAAFSYNNNEDTVRWLNLKLSLLRFYREEGFRGKWATLSSELDTLYNRLSPPQKASLHYERCLSSIFALDIASCRQELEKWSEDMSLPYWAAKRAMILAELGDLKDAGRILEVSLNEIRGQLNLQPDIMDYQLVSQEAYILQMLIFLSGSISIKAEKERETYSIRHKKLMQYECDPWGELNLFEAHIRDGESAKYQTKEINYCFEIGCYIPTYRLNPYNKAAGESYAFLRYIEEVGLALKTDGAIIGVDVAHAAIKTLSDYSPVWTYSTLARAGEKKIIDTVFNRKTLSLKTREYVETLAKSYLDVLRKYAIEYVAYQDKNTAFAVSVTELIPQILSRLCFKCSYETRFAIFEVAEKIALSARYGALPASIAKLINKVIESFSLQERCSIISRLVGIPIFRDRHNRIASVLESLPFDKPTECLPVDVDAHLVNLIMTDSLDEHKRGGAIAILMKLYCYGLLNQQQIKEFADNLWSRLDAHGFPDGTNYHYAVWLNYPHPDDVEPVELLRHYINTEPVRIESRRKGGISMLGGELSLPINIALTGTADYVNTYKWNADEINNLVMKLKEWWDEDKKFLKDKKNHLIGGDTADEFRKRFHHLTTILHYVIGPNYTFINNACISQIEGIVDELRDYDLPDLYSKVSVLALFPEKFKDLEQNVLLNLCSRDRGLINDAIDATLILNKKYDFEASNIINTIMHNIMCRTDVALDSFLDGMCMILSANASAFNDAILDKLEIGLSMLLSENVVLREDSQEDVANKLLVRISLAKLIPILSSYFAKKGADSPTYITDWEVRLTDENEFVDITNAFMAAKEGHYD